MRGALRLWRRQKDGFRAEFDRSEVDYPGLFPDQPDLDGADYDFAGPHYS
jgi:hypothetical protein